MRLLHDMERTGPTIEEIKKHRMYRCENSHWHIPYKHFYADCDLDWREDAIVMDVLSGKLPDET